MIPLGPAAREGDAAVAHMTAELSARGSATFETLTVVETSDVFTGLDPAE